MLLRVVCKKPKETSRLGQCRKAGNHFLWSNAERANNLGGSVYLKPRIVQLTLNPNMEAATDVTEPSRTPFPKTSDPLHLATGG